MLIVILRRRPLLLHAPYSDTKPKIRMTHQLPEILLKNLDPINQKLENLSKSTKKFWYGTLNFANLQLRLL